jgi:putative ABC transport system permease protein
MEWLNQLIRRARMLRGREQFDRELDEEMRLHMELRGEEEAARGASSQDAQFAAQRRFGNALLLRERSQDAWGWTWLVQMVQDVRYGARTLSLAPGFTVITVVTLALGLGATTAIFGAVNPILFEPLPYPHADRLMMIWETRPDRPRQNGTYGMYHGLAERSRTFESFAVLKNWQPSIARVDEKLDRPDRLEGQRVTAGYFQVLGVSPMLGRDFQPSDDIRNGPNVVILGNAFWRRCFHGDPGIVGRPVMLDDSQGSAGQRGSYLVIGVMPENFENVLAPAAEVWSPMQYDMMTEYPAWGHHVRTVARLRPGVSVDQAAREIGVLGPAIVKEKNPSSYEQTVKFTVTSLQDDVTRSVRPALLAVLGAVALLLVIACVNVTNLLLARGVQRRGEFALRAALGAGRNRLIRQLLTESLLIAMLGGVAGMAVAALGVRALVALSPPELPRLSAIAVDGTVFAFGLAITTLIGLAFGLFPAWHAARNDPYRDLQHGSRRTAGGHRRARSTLVIAEVALALVLLVGSGLLLRSLTRLFAIPPGFHASHVVTMQIQTSGHRFDDAAVSHRFFEQLLEAVKRVPGVTSAGLTSQLPLSGEKDEYGVTFDANSAQRPDEDHSAFRYTVSPGYLETMGIPLREGRLLDDRDTAGAPLAVLIPESYARREFPGADPVGQHLHIGPTTGAPYTIVGVVGDVKQLSLTVSKPDAIYVTRRQWLMFADGAMSLVVRAQGDAAALAPAIREAVWSVDKDQPVVRIATMDDLVAASEAERRFALIVFEAFALVALMLAAAGIYGLLAGSVAERTREIGVRAALGASRGNIVGLVFRQGMTLTTFGVAMGVAGAVAASRAIEGMLFGVSRLDAVTYAGVLGLIGGVAMVACAVPAWRAARVDPASTLRAE